MHIVLGPFVWSSHTHKMTLQVRGSSLFYLMHLLYHYHQLFIDIERENLFPCHSPQQVPTWEEETKLTKPSTSYISPKSEPALELHNRAVPSMEAHYHVNGPNTGRNSGGRQIKTKKHTLNACVYRSISWYSTCFWQMFSGEERREREILI